MFLDRKDQQSLAVNPRSLEPSFATCGRIAGERAKNLGFFLDVFPCCIPIMVRECLNCRISLLLGQKPVFKYPDVFLKDLKSVYIFRKPLT